MGARAKASRKKTTRSTSKKSPAKKKAVALKKKPAIPTPEILARKIMRATREPDSFNVEDLYAEDAVSQEPGSEPSVGLAAIAAKAQHWESITESTVWTVRNTFIKRNTIAIEWDLDVVMSDGRKLQLSEVAVHEVKGGKIVAERFFYDPSALAPPQPEPEPEPPPAPEPPPELESDPSNPPIDPMDL